ncbi:MAG TPA: hypothetical protein PK176_07425 [Acidobacteriota bacterium]|nr:hypothetical protein [Acidobacteriota bacterium]HQM63129.1 hypothetical protein [Acidobacteriota bacterium]
MKISDGAACIQSGNAPPVQCAPLESVSGCAVAVSDSDRTAP